MGISFALPGLILTKELGDLNSLLMMPIHKSHAQHQQWRQILQRGGNFQRIVDAGRIIGVDAITGQATSKFTIITNKAGDLINSFPGLPGR